MPNHKKKKNKGYSKKTKRQVEAKIGELIGKNYSDFEVRGKRGLLGEDQYWGAQRGRYPFSQPNILFFRYYDSCYHNGL